MSEVRLYQAVILQAVEDLKSLDIEIMESAAKWINSKAFVHYAELGNLAESTVESIQKTTAALLLKKTGRI